MTEVHPELYDNKCVCQICTCHKHKCPHCDLNIPLDGTSSYKNDYHKHPLHVWTKPKDNGK
jgi:hypothetical protein